MPQPQVRVGWRSGSAPTVSQLLASIVEPYTSYSFRKTISTYSGPIVTVRRSYDNAETDIGLSGEYLNTAALQSFVDEGISLGNQDAQNWDSLTYAGKSVVSSGLSLYLDAATASSYSGSGTSISSLAGGISGTLSGVSYDSTNGGCLIFASSSSISLSGNAIASASDFTLSAWIYMDQATQDASIMSWGTDASSLKVGIAGQFATYSVVYKTLYSTVKGSYGATVSVGPSPFSLHEQYTEQWIDFSVTSSAGTTKIYINGSELASFAGASYSLDSLPAIGQSFVGRISKVLAYDRALSSYEIMENYMALCGSFAEDHHAKQFVEAAGITDPVQISAVNELARELKNAKLWGKLKFVYPFVGGTEQAHKLNLLDPRDANDAYRLQFTGTWSHTSSGARPSNGFANTFYNPALDPFVTNNFMQMSIYTRDAFSSTGIDIGYRNTTVAWYMQANSSNAIAYGNHTNATGNSNASGGGSGHYMIQKLSNFNLYGTYVYVFSYKNGTQVGSTQVGYSTAPLSLNIYLAAINNGGTASSYSNRELSFAATGDGLTNAEIVKYENIVQRFQTALGRAVVSGYEAGAQHPDNEIETFLRNARISSATQSSAVAGLIGAMKAEGIWHRSMAVYPYVGGNANAHRMNAKSFMFDMDFGGGWTHSSTGAIPNGTTGYANTYIIPCFDVPENDSAYLCTYLRTNTTNANGFELSANDASRVFGIRNVNKRIYSYMKSSIAPTIDPKESTGFMMGLRGDSIGDRSSKSWMLHNDTIEYASAGDLSQYSANLAGTHSTSNTAWIYLTVSSVNIGTNAGYYSFSNREHSFDAVGRVDMTEMQALRYSRIVQRYQAALGREISSSDNPYSNGDAAVTTWYDQGSQGLHLRMNTKASQPKICLNGTIVKDANNKVALQFDGWNDFMLTPKSINFTTLDAVVAVYSASLEGITTGANNATLQTTNNGPYLPTAYTHTNERFTNYRMAIRPFADNYFTSTIAYGAPAWYSNSSGIFAARWGDATLKAGTMVREPGINVSMLWDENAALSVSSNFIIDTPLNANFQPANTTTLGSLGVGGLLDSGSIFRMSKMKMQEILKYPNSIDFNIFKTDVEKNIYSYYQPFTYSRVADADADAFSQMARLTQQEANIINTLVTSMKSAGLWDKMIMVHPFIGGTAYKHSLDLKRPSHGDNKSRIIFRGNMTHDATGSKYTPTNPYGQGVIYQDITDRLSATDIHASFYVGGGTLKNLSGTYNSYLWSYGRSNTYVPVGFLVNGTQSITYAKSNSFNSAIPVSSYLISNSSSVNALYRNGVLAGTSSIPAGATFSNAQSSHQVNLGCGWSGYSGYIDVKQSFFTLGYSLTEQEISDLNTIVQAYQAALGRQVL